MKNKSSSYSEKLKNPKWQKKRLEILERDEFTCQDCASTENTLHVHHSYYEYGLDPWEYPSESLVALCDSCHKKAEDNKQSLKTITKSLDRRDLARLVGYLNGHLLMYGEDRGYVPYCSESLDGFMDATINSRLAPLFAKSKLFEACTNASEPITSEKCKKIVMELKRLK